MSWLFSAWFVSAALGWSVGDVTLVAGPAEVRAVAVGQWSGRAVVAWAGPSGVRVVPVEGGEPLLQLRGATARVVMVDVDGDGATDLVQCGSGGLTLVRAADAKPRVLSTEPCADVVRLVPTEGWPSLLVRSGTKLKLWAPDGGAVRQTALDGEVREDFPLSSHKMAWAAGTVAGLRLSAEANAELASAVPLRSVAWGPEGWTWLREDGGVDSFAGTGQVLAGATGLLEASLEGRRVLLVAQPEVKRVSIVLAGMDAIPVQLPVAPTHTATADLTGDGCTDWFVSDAAGNGALVRGLCGAAVAASKPAEAQPLAQPAAATERAMPAPLVVESAPEAKLNPNAIRLKAVWTPVVARVGVPLTLDLVGADGGAAKFSVRGAPPGFIVDADGHVSWVPTEQDLGMWGIGIRVRAGSSSYGSGIDLEVRDGK